MGLNTDNKAENTHPNEAKSRLDLCKSNIGLFSTEEVKTIEEIKRMLNGYSYTQSNEIITEVKNKLGHMSVVEFNPQ